MGSTSAFYLCFCCGAPNCFWYGFITGSLSWVHYAWPGRTEQMLPIYSCPTCGLFSIFVIPTLLCRFGPKSLLLSDLALTFLWQMNFSAIIAGHTRCRLPHWRRVTAEQGGRSLRKFIHLMQQINFRHLVKDDRAAQGSAGISDISRPASKSSNQPGVWLVGWWDCSSASPACHRVAALTNSYKATFPLNL